MLDAILYINPFHYKLEHGMVFMKLQPCVTQLEIFQILVTHLNAKNGHLCSDSFIHMGIVSRLSIFRIWDADR